MPGLVAGRRAVTVNPGGPLGTIFQTIDGFGATYRAFTHPDMWWTGGTGPAAPVSLTAGEENAIHDTLYLSSGIGLTRARTTDPTNGGTDVDPRTFKLQATDGGAFTYTGPRLDDLAAYIGKAKARSLARAWWSPQHKEAWMSGLSSATPNATEVGKYADWMFAAISRWATDGQPLDCFAISNEPDYAFNPMSAQFTRDVIKNLCPRLAAAGLTTRVVLNDGNKTSTSLTFFDTVMGDASAAPYVYAIGLHTYDEALSNLANARSRATTYGLPLWVTEFSTTTLGTMSYPVAGDIGWANAVHDMLTTYSVAAVDFMWGAFGSQDTSSLVSLAYTSGGAYTGQTVRKIARYMGQYARYVRPGDIRVSASSSDAGAKVSCYWRANGTRVVVAVNPSGSPITTNISAADLAGKTTASVVRSSASEDWASLSAQSISGGAMSVTLPATSVTTFVAP